MEAEMITKNLSLLLSFYNSEFVGHLLKTGLSMYINMAVASHNTKKVCFPK